MKFKPIISFWNSEYQISASANIHFLQEYKSKCLTDCNLPQQELEAFIYHKTELYQIWTLDNAKKDLWCKTLKQPCPLYGKPPRQNLNTANEDWSLHKDISHCH